MRGSKDTVKIFKNIRFSWQICISELVAEKNILILSNGWRPLKMLIIQRWKNRFTDRAQLSNHQGTAYSIKHLVIEMNGREEFTNWRFRLTNRFFAPAARWRAGGGTVQSMEAVGRTAILAAKTWKIGATSSWIRVQMLYRLVQEKIWLAIFLK